MGVLGCLHLSCGPVGPLAKWAATSNVEGESGMMEGGEGPLAREGGLSSDKLFLGAP